MVGAQARELEEPWPTPFSSTMTSGRRASRGSSYSRMVV
jgi:hypothetical protein